MLALLSYSLWSGGAREKWGQITGRAEGRGAVKGNWGQIEGVLKWQEWKGRKRERENANLPV